MVLRVNGEGETVVSSFSKLVRRKTRTNHGMLYNIVSCISGIRVHGIQIGSLNIAVARSTPLDRQTDSSCS